MVSFMLPGPLLEFVNGYLFVVCLGLTVFYGSYLYRRVKAGYRYGELKIGFAFLIYILGDTIIRAPVWYYRHMDNGGRHITDTDTAIFWAIATFGALLAISGGLCALRVSAPDWMKWWPWVGAAVAALVFAMITVFF